jgi:hypothetical protein
MANPKGIQGPRAKPYRDALRMEITAAGADFKLLRMIASAHINKALSGDLQAIKELADRLDGKVAQPVVGGDDDDAPVRIEQVQRTICDPQDKHGEGVQAAIEGGEV